VVRGRRLGSGDARAEARLLGEIAADLIAKRVGSWGFVLLQTGAISAWIAAMASGYLSWDPFPFILLNLALSLQAAYTGPILLISANRMAAEDRAMMREILRTLKRDGGHD